MVRQISPAFTQVYEASRELNEANDCSVKAVTLLTGKPYREVHAAFAKAGRRNRGPTAHSVTAKAVESLGYRLEHLDTRTFTRDIIAKYPAPYDQRYKNVTTYHAQHPLFRHAWQGLPNLLLETKGHHAAFVDGNVHDWTDNRRFRIIKASRLVPLEK